MPSQTASQQETDAILRAAGVGGVVATGAAGAGAASGPVAVTAGGAVAVTGAQVAAAAAAAVASLRRGRTDEAAWLWLVVPLRRAFPQIPEGEIVRFARQEAERETEFLRRMEERLRERLPRALTQPDPVAAIETVLKLEREYLQSHEEASATRVEATIRYDILKRVSPEGAFWKLGENVKAHTPDCVAMAMVGWWPWEVLDLIHPPMHFGCECDLYSHSEAHDMGLMGDEIPDTTGAVEKARQIAQIYGLLQEAWWCETDSAEDITEAVAHLQECLHEIGVPSHGSGHSTTEIDTELMPAAHPPELQDVAVKGEIVRVSDRRHDDLQEGDENSAPRGVMVALYPARDIQDDLAVRGGEDPEEIHLTLAYLGKAEDLQGEDQAIQAVRRWAQDCPPLEGEISGYGYFMGNETGEGGKVTYASVDLPELPHERQRLVTELERAELPPRMDHGFTPHMTLDYSSRRPKLEPQEVRFDRITLAWAGRRYEFPLEGKPLHTELRESLMQHAEAELEKAGLTDKDSDYEGMLADEVLKLVRVFSEGGHSGGSAAMTTAILEKLLRFEPLTPLTSEPDEWMRICDERTNGEELWQSRRDPRAFSKDGGKTWEIMEASWGPGPLDIEEISYDRRYAKGTIYGGRFMPKRGGYAPRVPLKRIIGNVLGTQRGHRPTGRRAGQASPPSPPVREPDAPTHVAGTSSEPFDQMSEEVRTLASKVGEQAGVSVNLGTIKAAGDRPDTEGFRDWDGNVEIGGQGAAAVVAYREAARADQRIPDDLAGDNYHATRTTIHEALHSVNPISPEEYQDPAGFALEEALTEELAHVLTVEHLSANGGHDSLRWLARKPDDLRARGLYGPQRAALATVLDEAHIPLADRRELLERLAFNTHTENRLAILGGLLARTKGTSPEKGRRRVREALTATAELDPLAEGAAILRPPNTVDRRDRVHADATVRVGDRYEGVVSDAGYDADGSWHIEVEVDLGDGNKTWRYPNPHEVEVLKPAPRRFLKGEGVKGTVREGDDVRVTEANGAMTDMEIVRIDAPDALGWRVEAVDNEGHPVLLRPSSIIQIRRLEKGERGKNEASQDEKDQKNAPKASERGRKGTSERSKRTKAAKPVSQFKDVSGPLGFDARNYQDPRRSLITKIRAMPKDATLEMADGTKIVRGHTGDSAVIVRPDGTGKRYALTNRLVNEELKAILERHGLPWDEATKTRAKEEGMASPAIDGFVAKNNEVLDPEGKSLGAFEDEQAAQSRAQFENRKLRAEQDAALSRTTLKWRDKDTYMETTYEDVEWRIEKPPVKISAQSGATPRRAGDWIILRDGERVRAEGSQASARDWVAKEATRLGMASPNWTKDPPPVYDDPAIQEDAKTWAESLSREQRAAIEKYTADPFLRDDALESAARQGHLTSPTTAYRAVPGAGAWSKWDLDHPTSFTTNPEVAEWDFGDAVLSDDEDFTILEVELPSGAPMGFPSVGNEMMATQQELLLASGYQMVPVSTGWKRRGTGKGRIRQEKVRVVKLPGVG